MCKSLDSLRSSCSYEGNRDEQISVLREELSVITKQYMETMSMLNEKQRELGRESEKASTFQRKCLELESKLKKLFEIEKVFYFVTHIFITEI